MVTEAIKRTDPRTLLELGPATAYEAVTRQMVEQVVTDLADIKGRLNGLLLLVAGALIVDVIGRVAGV